MFKNQGLIELAEQKLKDFEKKHKDLPKNELVNSSSWQNLTNDVQGKKRQLHSCEEHLTYLQGKGREDVQAQIHKHQDRVHEYGYLIDREKNNIINQLKGFDAQIAELDAQIAKTKGNSKFELEMDRRLLSAESDGIILNGWPNVKKQIGVYQAEIAEHQRQIATLTKNYADSLADMEIQITELTGREPKKVS